MANKIKEFYSFLQERESVRVKKEAGEPKPWTKDKILQEYKFTNVKREHDTVTRKLREMYYENSNYSKIPLRYHLLNAAIFRYFGTWEFAEALCYMTTWDPAHIKKTAKLRMEAEERVFTGAYVISSFGKLGSKVDIVVDYVITDLYQKSEFICKIIQETGSWKDAVAAMKTVNGFAGTGFMAKEVLLDTMFSPLWAKWGGVPIDFNTYCPTGPGAARGLNRIFRNNHTASVHEEQMLEEMKKVWTAKCLFLPDNFPELCLHDIQFQLCEFDKYERVRLGEGRPRSKYNGVK